MLSVAMNALMSENLISLIERRGEESVRLDLRAISFHFRSTLGTIVIFKHNNLNTTSFF